MMAIDLQEPCYVVYQGDTNDSEPCPCCGEITRNINGTVALHGETCAVYLVRWSLGQVKRSGARYELILGRWDVEEDSKTRFVVRFDYRNDRNMPASIIVVDADDAFSYPTLAGVRMKRSDVIGTRLADEVFAIYDSIVISDTRLCELHA